MEGDAVGGVAVDFPGEGDRHRLAWFTSRVEPVETPYTLSDS